MRLMRRCKESWKKWSVKRLLRAEPSIKLHLVVWKAPVGHLLNPDEQRLRIDNMASNKEEALAAVRQNPTQAWPS